MPDRVERLTLSAARKSFSSSLQSLFLVTVFRLNPASSAITAARTALLAKTRLACDRNVARAVWSTLSVFRRHHTIHILSSGRKTGL